ncbi:MAG: hypothetical protein QME81_17185 [bacterium]|nr:hypothetical protein [bacterium]
MIKINKKDNFPDREGRESLKEIVEKRVSLDLFEPDALDELIENCGGCIKDLLRLIRYCCVVADEKEMPPITEKVAESAVRKMMNEMDRRLPQDYYPKLARVHHEKSAPNDPDHQLMLLNLSILEYNGEQRWQDVHPVLKMTSSFKEAWKNETRLQE